MSVVGDEFWREKNRENRCGGVRCRLHRLSFSFSYTPNGCRPHKAQSNTAYFIISAAHSDKQSAIHSHSVDTQVKVIVGSRKSEVEVEVEERWVAYPLWNGHPARSEKKVARSATI